MEGALLNPFKNIGPGAGRAIWGRFAAQCAVTLVVTIAPSSVRLEAQGGPNPPRSSTVPQATNSAAQALLNECLVTTNSSAAVGSLSVPAASLHTQTALAALGAVAMIPVFQRQTSPSLSGGLGALSAPTVETTFLVHLAGDDLPGTTTTDLAEVEDACAALTAAPSVQSSQPNYLYTSSLTPNDPLITHQTLTAFEEMNAFSAWEVTTGSADVIVAVVDSGVTPHPDLAGRLLPGYDFVDDDNSPLDGWGHGTHVAGIVAATGNNGEGSAGVAWNARILPVRVLNNSGEGSTADIIQGIQYAADQGARVINLSLGTLIEDPALQTALQYALSAGSLPVAAVGNSSKEQRAYPAAYREALAVGAHWSLLAYAGFSNFGAWVDIAAPGLDIDSLSNDGTNFEEKSGTSMAAPFVAGAAALILAVEPNLTVHELRARLLATANGDLYGNVANAEHMYNKRMGVGALDLLAAVTDDRSRQSIAKIVVRAGSEQVPESFLSAGTTYTLEVEVENVAPAPRTVDVAVSSSEPNVTITGGATQTLTLPTGVPVALTGLTLAISTEATPNAELPLTVTITPGSGPAEVHSFIVTRTFQHLAGWPIAIPQCSPGALALRPAFVLHTADGVKVVQPNGDVDRIHYLNPDGTLYRPYYQAGPVLYSVVPANLTNAADDELAYVTGSDTLGGFLSALSPSDGTTLSGWPVEALGSQAGQTGHDLEAPVQLTVADLDGDGVDEVIGAEERLFKSEPPYTQNPPGAFQTRVYALRSDGSVMTGWPAFIDGQISYTTAPAVGNIINSSSGPETLELAVPIESMSMSIVSGLEVIPPPPPVVILGADGAVMRILAPARGPATRCGPGGSGIAIADFDSDGAAEVARWHQACGIQLWRSTGEQVAGFPTTGGVTSLDALPGDSAYTHGGQPAIADIDGDGSLDIAVQAVGFRVTGTGGVFPPFNPVEYEMTLAVVGSDGQSLDGFPKVLETVAYPHQYWVNERGSTPLLVDIDGDGRREIFAQALLTGVLHGFYADGSTVPGFPIRFRRMATPQTPFSFADIDLDGSFEMISAADFLGKLAIFRLPFQYAASSTVPADPAFAPWPRGRANHKNTSRSPDTATNFLIGTPVPTSTPTPTPTATATPPPTATPTPPVAPTLAPTATPHSPSLGIAVSQTKRVDLLGKVSLRIRTSHTGNSTVTPARARVHIRCTGGKSQRKWTIDIGLSGQRTMLLTKVRRGFECVFKAQWPGATSATMNMRLR